MLEDYGRYLCMDLIASTQLVYHIYHLRVSEELDLTAGRQLNTRFLENQQRPDRLLTLTRDKHMQRQ